MKYCIVYDADRVISVSEDTGEIPHFASANIFSITTTLAEARQFLLSQAIDVTVINQFSGYTPPLPVNPVFEKISSLPSDPSVIRYAHFSTMPIFNEENILLFNVRIEHYREIEGVETYIPDEQPDRYKKLTADDTTEPFITLPDNTVMGEFSYFIWALNQGIHIFDLMRSSILQRDIEERFNFY